MEVPLIIASEHEHLPYPFPELESIAYQITQLLKNLKPTVVPRKFYFEGSNEFLKWVNGEFNEVEQKDHYPFSTATKIALENGWKLIPLDKQSHSLFIQRADPFSKLVDFGLMNLRERNWGNVLRRNPPTQNDIILINHNHLAGLLAESGLKGTNVQKKISSIAENIALIKYRRFTLEEVRRFNEERKRKKIKRVLEGKRVK